MRISLEKAAELLKSYDDIRLVCHRFPDGDTVGSAFALCIALRMLGKRAFVTCIDKISDRYRFVTDGAPELPSFEPKYTVTVDVADYSLIGEDVGKPDLAIDHHGTHRDFAENAYVKTASSTAEIIYELVLMLGAEVSHHIANGIYIGVSTDTGCFRYKNTNAASLKTAAAMIEAGADFYGINTAFFETKSKVRIEIEKKVLGNLEYFLDGRCAVIVIDEDILSLPGFCEDDIDGISAMPRQIQGVCVGITLRVRPEGYKASVRTVAGVDASRICAKFGGGGHPGASGCTLSCTLDEAKRLLVSAAAEELGAK